MSSRGIAAAYASLSHTSGPIPRPAGSLLRVCMQCVAQGAPAVGIALAVLNRRNLKVWGGQIQDRWAGSADIESSDAPERAGDRA